MANEEQLARLQRSVKEWNQWREENPSVRVNLINANLRSANLINADLININLNDANLINGNLSYGNLSYGNLSYGNLSHANLININLSEANLSSSNLRSADLINANLVNANLTAIQALNTNFEGTNLTGTYIQDWNINSKTNLNDVICEYIYLNSDLEIHNGKLNRVYTDRRPQDCYFAPDEFLRLFQIVQDDLSFYFKDGVDWQAVAYSFQYFLTNTILLDIEGIHKTKNGGIIITVNTPDNIDKDRVEREFWKEYEIAQKAFEEGRRKVDSRFVGQEEQKVRYEGKINRLLAMLDKTRTIEIHNDNPFENKQIEPT
ncbi:MAG: pentapeptide repeat-containing protein [Cyanobacteria bacterium P01_E01_bin.42]